MDPKHRKVELATSVAKQGYARAEQRLILGPARARSIAEVLNFRYHVVSITAIFLGIALGIAVGVGFAPSLDSSLARQAAVDREQVTQLRRQLDQQNRVNAYSEAWSQQVDTASTKDALAGRKVALVTMSGAPTTVVDNLESAVVGAGGTVTTSLSVNDDATSASPSPVGQLLSPADTAALGLNEDDPPPTQLGELLGAALGDLQIPASLSKPALLKAVETEGLIKVSSSNVETPTDLVLVVSSATATTDGSAAIQDLHAGVVHGIAANSKVVVAGPNSTGVTGTDLDSIRSEGTGGPRVSTIDTADLASGQLVTILACRERLTDRTGNYGAAPGVTGPFPT